jgi:hypothetical protein
MRIFAVPNRALYQLLVLACLVLRDTMARPPPRTGTAKNSPAPPNYALPSAGAAPPSVFFQHVGQTVHTLEYANIRIHLDISTLFKDINKLRDAMGEYRNAEPRHKWNNEDHRYIQKELLIQRCEILKTELDFMSMLKQQAHTSTAPTRNRRFVIEGILIGLAVALTAGAAYSFYRADELYKMNHMVNTLSTDMLTDLHETKRLGNTEAVLDQYVTAVANISKMYYADFEKNRIDESAVYMAERRVNLFKEVIVAAMDNRIAPSLMHDINMPKMFKEAEEYAAANGLEIMAKFQSDFFQLDASFQAAPDGFYIFVHLPMYEPDTVMNVFRHMRLPFPLPDTSFHLAIDSTMEYIAVNSDATLFRGMTEAEIESCSHKGPYYFCTRGNMVRRAPGPEQREAYFNKNSKDAELCLFALFTHDYPLAKYVCDVQLGRTPSAVAMLSPNEFAVYTQTPHKGSVNCRDPHSKQARTFHAAGITTVKLDPGCVAYTNDHVFAPLDVAFSDDAAKYRVAYHWPFTPEEMAKGLNVSRFEELISRHKRDLLNQTRINLDDAIASMTELESLDSPVFDWLGNTPNGIFMLLAGLALLIAIKACCCSTTRQSAAPAIINNPPANIPNMFEPGAVPFAQLLHLKH